MRIIRTIRIDDDTPFRVCTAQAVKLRLIIKAANIDIIFIAISLVYSCPDVYCKNQDHPLL
jgi:hypothetical protein